MVDSASLEVQRRSRRAQTERLDVPQRLTMRLRYAAGARKGWSVGRVPRVAEADRRQLQRARLTAPRDRTWVRQRMQGWRAGDGVRRALHGEVEAPLAPGPQADGALRPPAWRARRTRAWPPVCCLPAQRTEREGARRAARRTRPAPVMAKVRPWSTVRGSGGQSAWLVVLACCAWRDLQTPTHGGAGAGRTPTPDQRGASRRDRGLPRLATALGGRWPSRWRGAGAAVRLRACGRRGLRPGWGRAGPASGRAAVARWPGSD